MLFPYAHAWTPLQRWLIASGVALVVVALGTLVYSYERYYRGPGESALYGAWEVPGDFEDEIYQYQFARDHTFSVLWRRQAGELSFLGKGKWYAGGENIYLRFPEEMFDGRELIVWHIADITPNEIRFRVLRNGEVHSLKRVSLALPQASNQAMQRTAGRSAARLKDESRIMNKRRSLSPAVADLVSR